MQVEHNNSKDLVVSSLPDGSKVIVDSKGERVFALNATAGAAWDACNSPTTLGKVAEGMEKSLHLEVTEDLAEDAILRLKEQQLVTTSSSPKTSRRQALAALGAVALPLVVSLTLGEQKAYASFARSGNPPHFHRPVPHVPRHRRLY